MRFRPGRFPTLFVLVSIPVLLALGFWQLQRTYWKDDLIARIEAQLSAPPLPVASAAALPREEFVRVRLEGRFQPDTLLWLGGRTDAGRAGWHVVAPFLLPDGGWVIVDRGWVPMAARDRNGNVPPAVAGPAEGAVEGVVRLPPEGNLFTPGNDAAGNAWYRIDPPAMAAAAGLPAGQGVADAYVAAASATGAAPPSTGAPIASGDRFDLPRNHFQYAMTWFGLAVTLLGVYLAYGLRRDPDPVPDDEREQP